MKKRGFFALLLCSVMLVSAGCSADRTEDELAYRKIALRYMEQGEYAQAIENFQLALDQSKGKIRNLELDICMNKAEAMYCNGQTEDAIEVCDAVLAYDGDYANAYYLRGNLYLLQDKVEEALADYEQAAAHADADFSIYIQLYENLSRAGREDEGIAYLNQALALKGKGREYQAGRGYIYYLLGDYEQARVELEKAVAIDKKEGEEDKAQLYLAQTYEKLGEQELAAEYYESYAKDHADDSIVLEALGSMAMEQGNFKQALSYYESGLATKAPVNEQKLLRGRIAACERLYEFEQAKEYMAQYVLDYPDDEEAAREYLFLKTRTAVADQIKVEQAASAQGEVEFEDTTEDTTEGDTDA